MKSSQFLILLVLIIIILMAVTNPGINDYVIWISDQSSEEASSQLEEILTNLVGEPMVRRTTSRDNYVIFSIYETEVPELNGGESSKTIGIFGNFFVLNDSDE